MQDEQGPDVVVEVSERGWMDRLGDSVKAMVVGFVLIVVAFPLLVWNEGRAVGSARALAEGRATVITVPTDVIGADHDGHLVHLSGRLTTPDLLVPVSVLPRPAIKLHRSVALFQWEEVTQSETRDKVGGGTSTETTYTYRKVWAEGLNDSTRFHKPGGHSNPAALPMAAVSLVVEHANVGAFRLTRPVLDAVNHDEPVSGETLSALARRDVGRPLAVAGEWAYSGSPDAPKLGDFRLGYRLVPQTEISVVARQVGSTLEPHRTRSGGELLIVSPGLVGADAMFAEAEGENAILTWILRLAGWLIMLIGFVLLGRLLVAVAAVLPMLGNLVGAGIFLVALPLSLCLSLLTIAFAWIGYRPMIGIPVLVLGLAALAAPMLRRRLVPATAGKSGRVRAKQ